MIAPLFNQALIEIVEEEGIIGADKLENIQQGILRDFDIIADHLTASAGYAVKDIELYNTILRDLVGKVVYWQEYADAGSQFTIDGKKYVIIPWYRITAKEK